MAGMDSVTLHLIGSLDGLALDELLVSNRQIRSAPPQQLGQSKQAGRFECIAVTERRGTRDVVAHDS
jgi:hypothetical protein